MTQEKTPAVICSHIVKDYTLYSSFGEKLRGLILREARVKTFRALDDLSVTFNRGECVGLVGLNGSGKSTLASIITGITAPTGGTVDVRGEVSMLAASSGMRSQLSGVDNIRFKCLLMGYSREQIRQIEKDIIEFADIGIHIDQPVKTYSSGMRSRLGFAIAVHIDPDILIIDEALSVGDSSFTDKCLEKVDEFRQAGKTIVFVSHAITTMTTFCDRVVWINQGRFVGEGAPDQIVKAYGGFAREYNGMTNEQRAAFVPVLADYQQRYC